MSPIESFRNLASASLVISLVAGCSTVKPDQGNRIIANKPEEPIPCTAPEGLPAKRALFDFQPHQYSRGLYFDDPGKLGNGAYVIQTEAGTEYQTLNDPIQGKILQCILKL